MLANLNLNLNQTIEEKYRVEIYAKYRNQEISRKEKHHESYDQYWCIYYLDCSVVGVWRSPADQPGNTAGCLADIPRLALAGAGVDHPVNAAARAGALGLANFVAPLAEADPGDRTGLDYAVFVLPKKSRSQTRSCFSQFPIFLEVGD